ncbi:MAG: HNH endonuclease [Cyanobium sp. PLM2.Bin73]|nr:MAG: HNH endonuclease [Cyanobium sp. PLM2.Bin73]
MRLRPPQRHRTPISGSIKVRVLTRARGRRECCGSHEHQRVLEVDHIVPRSHGGSDYLNNLQALCFRCNAGKRWEARGGLWVLRAGGQRPGAAEHLGTAW